jgi:alpha-tubulin suppressor-like RCC1 family protein
MRAFPFENPQHTKSFMRQLARRALRAGRSGAILLLIAIGGAAITACSSDTSVINPAPFGLELAVSPATATTLVSDTITTADNVKLSLSAASLGVPTQVPKGVLWETSDATVAVVDSTGMVKPRGVGSAVISARVNTTKASATINVGYKAVQLSVSPTTIAALSGDTITITARALDSDGVVVNGTVYRFSASDGGAATVTRTGNQTARVLFTRTGQVRVDVIAAGKTIPVNATMQPRDFVAAVALSAPAGALTIGAGGDATCGLLPLGRGYCFGRGTLLGAARDTSCFDDRTNGRVPCTLVPLPIAGKLTLTSISVGETVACGTATDGRAYCWGNQESGQLGNGNSTGGTSQAPSLVAGTPFSRVTAGGRHACGIFGGPPGLAYCWGNDSLSQLGNSDGLPLNSSTPVPVGGGLTFTQIAAGRFHTCGLRADGTAYCWGDNTRGQVGAGPIGPNDFPTQVPGRYTQITTGALHTCALTNTGGVYCWGANEWGQLGLDNTDDAFDPQAVAPGLAFRSISAGGAATCGVTTAGAAYCWGRNDYGQIGNGVVGGSVLAPTPVAGGHTDFVTITVGTRHACAVAPDGAYCWGSNVLGALGNELQAIIQTAPTKTAVPR